MNRILTLDEKTFFEYEDVKITNTRFISGGQTYAMSNITSVKAFEQKPKRLLGILGVILGLGIASQSALPGIVIAIGFGIFLFMQKTVFHVMLSTSSGESSALKTHQREYLQKVVGALNNAIVHRG